MRLRNATVWLLDKIIARLDHGSQKQRLRYAKRITRGWPAASENRDWLFNDWVPNGENAMPRCPTLWFAARMRRNCGYSPAPPT
jgi:hypothetical protein